MREEIEKMENEVKKIKEESDLYRILKLEDRKNKRICWLIFLLIILLIIYLKIKFVKLEGYAFNISFIKF